MYPGAVRRALWSTLVLLALGCGRVGFETDEIPTPAACPASAILCDDFESGGLERWSGIFDEGEATVSVSGARVRSGALALDAAVAAAESGGGGAAARLFIAAQSRGAIAVRQWINPASPLSSFSLVAALLDDNGAYITAGGNNDGKWVATEEGGAGQFDYHTEVRTPPENTWTCVELLFTFPQLGEPARIQIFVDDAEVLSIAAADPAPEYTQVQVGVARSGRPGFHVFVDDVVIATERVGCD